MLELSIKIISTDENSKIEVRWARTPLVIDLCSQFALISSRRFSSFLFVPTSLLQCSTSNFSFVFLFCFLTFGHSPQTIHSPSSSNTNKNKKQITLLWNKAFPPYWREMSTSSRAAQHRTSNAFHSWLNKLKKNC